jgi:hypothetical protein
MTQSQQPEVRTTAGEGRGRRKDGLKSSRKFLTVYREPMPISTTSPRCLTALHGIFRVAGIAKYRFVGGVNGR